MNAGRRRFVQLLGSSAIAAATAPAPAYITQPLPAEQKLRHHYQSKNVPAESAVTLCTADLAWLDGECRRLLAGCRRTALDGTALFTPDGSGHYGALWTRDFAYMVEGAGDLLSLGEIEAAIRYLLRCQKPDGTVPDRVQIDGRPVYSAGPAAAPLGAPPTDNSQFLVKLVWSHWKLAGEASLAREALPQLLRAMDAVPRRQGLVWIDPKVPRSPYGFTDSVGKSGMELFSSLLYWEASRDLAEMCGSFNLPNCRKDFAERAGRIERALSQLWSGKEDALLAATVACRQVDVWGNAYAIYIGFPLGGRRARVLNFLEKNLNSYAWCGQIRHLLRGQYWSRLLVRVKPDTYQNGGHWGTASGWVAYALSLRRPDLASRLYWELLDDYRRGGPCEWISPGTRRLSTYVVSAANPRAALRKLRSEGRLQAR